MTGEAFLVPDKDSVKAAMGIEGRVFMHCRLSISITYKDGTFQNHAQAHTR